MRTEGRTEVKNSVGRLIFVAVSVLVQVGWFLILVLRLNEYSAGISIVSGILALCAVLAIYGKRINAAYKMPWIMLILAFPVLGLSLYLLAGRSGVTVVLEELTPDSLASYNADAFVCTACPRVAMDESARYGRPMLTVPELEIALGLKEWAGYPFDQIRG